MFSPDLCHSIPGKSGFEQRVKSFWEYQFKDDWGALYDYLSPSVKAQLTKEKFIKAKTESAPLQYISYNLGNMETSADLGWAEVSFTAKVKLTPDKPDKQLKIWQLWRKDDDGKWNIMAPEEAATQPYFPPSIRAKLDVADLARRVDEFWRAQETQKIETVYELCEPHFKQRMPFEEFVGKKSVYLYLSHSIEWVEAMGNSGRVKIKSTQQHSDPHLSKMPPKEHSSVEHWVRVDGAWYRRVHSQN